jgi:hypothetical protein
MDLKQLPYDIVRDYIGPMSLTKSFDIYDLSVYQLNQGDTPPLYNHYSSMMNAWYREKYDFIRNFKIPKEEINILYDYPNEFLPFVIILDMVDITDLIKNDILRDRLLGYTLNYNDNFLLEKIIPYLDDVYVEEIIIKLSKTNPTYLGILSEKINFFNVYKLDIQLNLDVYLNLMPKDLDGDINLLRKCMLTWLAQTNSFGEIGLWLRDKINIISSENITIPQFIEDSYPNPRVHTRVKYLYGEKYLHEGKNSIKSIDKFFLCDSELSNIVDFTFDRITTTNGVYEILNGKKSIFEEVRDPKYINIINCLLLTKPESFIINKTDKKIIFILFVGLLINQYFPTCRLLADKLYNLFGNLDGIMSLFPSKMSWSYMMSQDSDGDNENEELDLSIMFHQDDRDKEIFNIENIILSDIFIGKMDSNHYTLFKRPKTLKQYKREREIYGVIKPVSVNIKGYGKYYCNEYTRYSRDINRFNAPLIECILKNQTNQPDENYTDVIILALEGGDPINLEFIMKLKDIDLASIIDNYLTEKQTRLSSYTIEFLYPKMSEIFQKHLKFLKILAQKSTDPSLMYFLDEL